MATDAQPKRSINALDVACRVVHAEREALDAFGNALAGDLGESFLRAVEILAETRGRVVVTGMGKSGHIARKVAATLASTGTPAHFVHAAEASHGDLGMIADGDSVLAFSNSGETPELSNLLDYAHRFGIPLVAATGGATSTLASTANVALVLPDVPEACPIGLAPTVSTTLAIVAGDALAAALMERKGFTAADFRVFHPGGRLGNRLVHVSDLMHGKEELPLVSEDALMENTVIEMSAKGLGCAGVVNVDGCLAGIVTDGDLRRHMQPGLLALKTREVMTANPVTIAPEAFGGEALAIMNEHEIMSLFVVDEESRPLGALHMHDCVRAGIA